MPLYRSGGDMYQKYQAKYNPTVISTRFADVQNVALARAQNGLVTVATVRGLVAPILDSQSISGGQRGTYYAFALKLWKHASRLVGGDPTNLINALKSYFQTAYGLNPDVMDAIADVVAGYIARGGGGGGGGT